ncbi:MAG: hypothetical protein QOI01_4624 [Mycobacterium sp.]|jgi:hypothetical protein|nr:hypothetical protein [Mycobacterium sp.]
MSAVVTSRPGPATLPADRPAPMSTRVATTALNGTADVDQVGPVVHLDDQALGRVFEIVHAHLVQQVFAFGHPPNGITPLLEREDHSHGAVPQGDGSATEAQ